MRKRLVFIVVLLGIAGLMVWSLRHALPAKTPKPADRSPALTADQSPSLPPTRYTPEAASSAPLEPSPIPPPQPQRTARPPRATNLPPPDEAAQQRYGRLFAQIAALRDGQALAPEDAAQLTRMLSISASGAITWVNGLQTGERKELLQAALAYFWATQDPASAWNWASTQPEDFAVLAVIGGAGDRTEVATQAADWVYASPGIELYRLTYAHRMMEQSGYFQSALVFADSLDPEEHDIAFQTAMANFARADAEGALAYALQKPAGRERNVALLAAVNGWPHDRKSRLRELLPTFDDEHVRRLAEERSAP